MVLWSFLPDFQSENNTLCRFSIKTSVWVLFNPSATNVREIEGLMHPSLCCLCKWYCCKN